MFISIYDKGEHTAENLGGKGYGLWWMQQQGVNVPPALILPTTVCLEYMLAPAQAMAKVEAILPELLDFFLKTMGYAPLLSVRSGARVSMPGMMDTILNVGITENNTAHWKTTLGEACAINCTERFRTMYTSVVLNGDGEKFNANMSVEAQLLGCIEAVFQSWNNERAKTYRKLNNIPEEWGTAVVIQAMVFGNLNDNSGTGVLFTRNPDTGEDDITGEFLPNAQGEDVVDGSHTPLPLSEMVKWNPEVTTELATAVTKLENARRDVQDVEFTIQDGKLWILQTRNAKRSARAAVKIAVDMATSGLITPAEALKRVTPREYHLAQQPVIDPKFTGKPAFTGIPACSGIARGVVVHTSAAAVASTVPCILVTNETTPDDIGGMHAAVGVLTMNGGSTSHAAVVARSMNRVCVTGLGVSTVSFPVGTKISVDGSTGNVWLTEVPVIESQTSAEIRQLDNMMRTQGNVVPVARGFAGEHMVLNLTEDLVMEPNQLGQNVAALAAKVGSLMVDLRMPPSGSWGIYYSMFSNKTTIPELVEAIEKHVLAADRSKVTLICPPIPKVLGTIPSVSNLEELILAKGQYVIDGAKMTPAFKKVLKWQKGEGCHPMAFGTVNSGGPSYLSKSQAISLLLG